MLLIMFIPESTVFMLSLIMPPATGTSRANVKRRLLKASESALDDMLRVRLCTARNTAKRRPVPYVQKLFKKFIIPDKSMLFDIALTLDNTIIIFTHGSITFTEQTCVKEMINDEDTDEAAAVPAAPEAVRRVLLVPVSESMNAECFSRYPLTDEISGVNISKHMSIRESNDT